MKIGGPPAAAKPDMRYPIGSISKQFTASSVLLLQEEAKLSLDDPVGKYIPTLTRANEVTIRQLLSHTSGYQDYWPQDYVMPMMLQATTPQAIADRWAKRYRELGEAGMAATMTALVLSAAAAGLALYALILVAMRQLGLAQAWHYVRALH